MRQIFLCVLIVTLAVGCAGTPTAQPANTPDGAATETAIARNIYATLTAAPTAAPTMTATTAPTATQVPPRPAPTASATMPPTPTPEPRPTDTPTPEPSPTSVGPVAVVQSASINVRAGPGTGHAAITAGRKGDLLPVTGRNADGSWLEITLPDGRSGWIAATLVQLNVSTGEVAVAKTIPTPPVAPTSAPGAIAKPAAGRRDLEVTFLNPHYDCQQTEWQYTGDDNEHHPLWGYRSFQVDMYIKNNSQTSIEPPWRPKRWIITDGQKDVMNGLRWQWVSRSSGFYPQPAIQPGQSAGWTFLAFPIDRNQWVKAVEFEWNGQVYRQDFDLGPYGNNHNYRDCGDPAPHTDRPTPTPRP